MNGDGNPKITYYNDSEDNDAMRLDRYRIYFSDEAVDSDDKTNYYELVIPNQKWNNFVFNYHSTYVDLYINGKLERSFYFKDKLSIRDDEKIMTFGSENGLSGAVSNVRYYNRNLTNREIVGNYNLLMKKIRQQIICKYLL